MSDATKGATFQKNVRISEDLNERLQAEREVQGYPSDRAFIAHVLAGFLALDDKSKVKVLERGKRVVDSD